MRSTTNKKHKQNSETRKIAKGSFSKGCEVINNSNWLSKYKIFTAIQNLYAN